MFIYVHLIVEGLFYFSIVNYLFSPFFLVKERVEKNKYYQQLGHVPLVRDTLFNNRYTFNITCRSKKESTKKKKRKKKKQTINDFYFFFFSRVLFHYWISLFNNCSHKTCKFLSTIIIYII